MSRNEVQDTDRQVCLTCQAPLTKLHHSAVKFKLESVYLNTTLNFKIPAALVFQLEGFYKVGRLLTGLTAQ